MVGTPLWRVPPGPAVAATAAGAAAVAAVGVVVAVAAAVAVGGAKVFPSNYFGASKPQPTLLDTLLAPGALVGARG
eukprot:COSAG02_NODE_2188_length_9569_cov_21.824710_7_plen_76_part_00